MSRTLPQALADEFIASELKPFYAVELLFDSGAVRFWTGYGEITANGEEWSGSGQIMGIAPSNETTDLSANGMTLTFGGLDPNIVAIALTENYRGRTATLYIGALDSTNQPVSTLYQLFSGRMDVMSITEDGNTSTLTISIENVLIDLDRPRIRKYTTEEQLSRYPNDESLKYVASLQEKDIAWGR
jgi:hypothetical protein